MHVTDRSKTVVMLIDWDNLQICHSRDAPGTELDLQALIALAQSYGTLVSARAYAEWNLLSERLAVYKAGIEPVFAPVMRPEGSPREGKSLADTVMVADGVDLLWTVAPDVFVLATSDKDMIPLARIAKQRGAAVVILGSDLTAIPLVELSNVFITYRQLLRELDRVSELEAPVGRAPARERRLRESRRPSSEAYGGLGSGALGGGPIGAGGRSASRPIGIAGGPAPAAPTRPPRRRLAEPAVPAAPVEGEPAPPTPLLAAPPADDAPAVDVAGSGSEVTPRRRRRRGGRGRRTGLGGVSDANIEAGALQDALDETDAGDGTEVDRGLAAPTASTPDDIENAVLELLASRDRDGAPLPVSDEAPTETGRLEEVAPSAPVEESTPAPARRVARTSFSSFGPPELPIRPPSSAAPSTDADTGAKSDGGADTAQGDVDSEPGLADAAASPEQGSITQGLAPDAVVSEALPVEPVADEAFPQIAPVSAEETVLTPESEEAVTSATVADAGRSSRSSRSSRSGSTRRTRRPAGGSADSGAPAASSATGTDPATPDPSEVAGDAAPRTPRRRRPRRPAGSASASTGEAVATEAGA
jgi:NYN domain